MGILRASGGHFCAKKRFSPVGGSSRSEQGRAQHALACICWVLEKAHKDITGLTSLQYEWEPVKKGRAVVAVRFIFSRRRALPVFTEKAVEAQAKSSARNNRIFQAAVACAEKKGQCCTCQDNKPGVCALCVKLGICKEISLRLI